MMQMNLTKQNKNIQKEMVQKYLEIKLLIYIVQFLLKKEVLFNL